MNNETQQSEILALREALEFYELNTNITVDDADADGNPLGFYVLAEICRDAPGYVTFGTKARKALTDTAEAGKQARDSVIQECIAAINKQEMESPDRWHGKPGLRIAIAIDALEALKGGGN